MKAEMRLKLAREPYPEKIRKVDPMGQNLPPPLAIHLGTPLRQMRRSEDACK